MKKKLKLVQTFIFIGNALISTVFKNTVFIGNVLIGIFALQPHSHAGVDKAEYDPSNDRLTVFYSDSRDPDDWIGVYQIGHVKKNCKKFKIKKKGEREFIKDKGIIGEIVFYDFMQDNDSDKPYEALMFYEGSFCRSGDSVPVEVLSSDIVPETKKQSEQSTDMNRSDSRKEGPELAATYKKGEINISYRGAKARSWVGIYKKEHIPDSCTSFEWDKDGTWFYISDTDGLSKISPRNPPNNDPLENGNYYVILFDDGDTERWSCHLTEPVSIAINTNNTSSNVTATIADDDVGVSGTVNVELNPYRNADWSQQRKGNFHTHTTESDGYMAPDSVTSAYEAAGYAILAITDHNMVTSADSGRMEMIRGNELSNGAHVNAFYNIPNNNEGGSAGVSETAKAGGISHWNHPNRSTSRATAELHASLRMQYRNSHLGIEVFNRGQDHILGNGKWDEINQILFFNENVNLFYWGFSNDDMHSRSELFRGFQFILGNKTKTSLTDGSFYFCRGSGNGTEGPINSIDVEQNGISILANGQISWFVTTKSVVGKNMGSGEYFSFGNLSEDAFIRARVSNDLMSCYTQPIGLRFD